MHSLLLAACLLVSTQSYGGFHRDIVHTGRRFRLPCNALPDDDFREVSPENVPPLAVKPVMGDIVFSASEFDIIVADQIVDQAPAGSKDPMQTTEIVPPIGVLKMTENDRQINLEITSVVNGDFLGADSKTSATFGNRASESGSIEKQPEGRLEDALDKARNVPEVLVTENIPEEVIDADVADATEENISAMAEELFFEFPTEEGNGDEYEEEGYDELVSETEIDTEDEIDTYFNSDNDVLKSGENIRKELLPHMPGVYVLQLENDCIYVGKSHQNVEGRVKEHFTSGGSAFTKKFRPISQLPTLTQVTSDLESFERAETLEQMWVRGIKNVRGWQYTKLYLTEFEYESIFRQMCERKDLCR